MEIKLKFDEDTLDYIKTKFDIDNEEDLSDAVWEMISTYMEMQERGNELMDTREQFLKAVDEVCNNCIFESEDSCENCPVRKTVDSLYDYAPYEIWVAWEESECWKDYVAGTTQFYTENVESCFKFETFETFSNTMYALTENPIASWYWVFVNGEPIIWGAMDSGDMEIVDEYDNDREE